MRAHNGNTLIFYQPQLDAGQEYKMLSARIAFSMILRIGERVFGVASLQAGILWARPTGRRR